MKTYSSLATFVAAYLLAAGVHPVHADEWVAHVSPSVTTGTYQDSTARSSLLERGITVSANYLDKGGVALGVSNASVFMKSGVTTTEQTNTVLSGHWSYQVPDMPGRWTVRMDLHSITNNDPSGDTDKVVALAPQLSWLSSDGMLYADLGYARTRYQNDLSGNDLSVNQLTPTLGFALNEGYDWVQVRSYLMSGMNPLRANGKSDASALEVKWTHFMSPDTSALLPASIAVGLVGGDRIYAVDMDAQSVANLKDIHTGTANIGLNWKLSKTAGLFVLLGQSRFRNLTTVAGVTSTNDYSLNVAHATLTFDF